jgi:hypothetical protein
MRWVVVRISENIEETLGKLENRKQPPLGLLIDGG